MNDISPSAVTHDAATTEIFANLFKAVVDEMAWILLRSSHTTFVKETQDFAVSLVTPEGEIFAYPYGSGATPIMGVPMHAGTQAVDDWEPGDVLFTNDPYSTGGMVMHLNDIYLFRPIFVDGTLLCFAWAFIHCTDVGGYAPGSIDMQNNEVFQEGLRMRPFRLYRRGELNTEMWHVFADNCRIPSLNWGDLTACTAALGKAEQRMHRLAQRYGRDAVAAAMRGTLDRTEQMARDVLQRIPAGEYRFTEFFEDDYISDVPVRIALKLVSHGDGRVTLDYTGSDPQVRAALNLPTGGMRRHPFLSMGLVNFVMTKAEGIHINAGILRCIDLVLPEASIVNARFPAACGMRFTTAMRVYDLVMGALSQALPGQVPAGGGNTLVVSYISTSELGSSGRVVVANPVPAGSAGGPDRDGVSGTDFSVAFLRNVPAEVLEAEVPVVVRSYGLVPDTEGAGRYRGGFGAEFEVEVRHPSAVLVMRGKDRFRFGSWGAFGGGGGSVNGNTGQRGDTLHDIGKRTVYRPEMAERIRMWSGGGGGYGDPLERDPAAVATDVVAELVSPARARDVYGVVMVDGVVDEASTARQRETLRAARGELPMFDFGPGRSEWERAHGEAAEQIAAWLPSLPLGVRRYAQGQVYRKLHETGAGPYGVALVNDVLANVGAALLAG
ncbi:MAG TPA: hydantoinase B/oxoprolinase family protein [Acetobacteraceae bacterium]|nr:hydantoinase B/oxoprolinase family protein [Acetobacteraceae bacterium]